MNAMPPETVYNQTDPVDSATATGVTNEENACHIED